MYCCHLKQSFYFFLLHLRKCYLLTYQREIHNFDQVKRRPVKNLELICWRTNVEVLVMEYEFTMLVIGIVAMHAG